MSLKYQLLSKLCQQCLERSMRYIQLCFELLKDLFAHHPLPVDEPVGGDVGVALHTPGQVELVTVEPVPQAGQHWLIGPT